ncbi:MAG: DUF58 domain-containing protein [Gammaproteobacteria bacterium]|nr:DUF58 domain-containing protein [Gammaproteobacteria bacterium]
MKQPSKNNAPLLNSEEIKRLIQHANSSTPPHNSSNQIAPVGENPASLIGSGMDFAEYRPYHRGDDPRHIDWRASARNIQTLTRRFNSEQDTPCCIVIDRNSSMGFATQTRLKATQAARVGIYCGAQLLKAGEQLSCLILDDSLYWQAASNSLENWLKTAQYASKAYPPNTNNSTTNWSQVSHLLQSNITQGSHLILISDFLSPADQQQKDHKALTFLSQFYNLTLACISDPAEHSLTQQQVNLRSQQQAYNISTRNDLKEINRRLSQYQQQLQHRLSKLNGTTHFIKTVDAIEHLTF